MCTALRLVALVGVILCTFSISISSQSAIQIPGKIEVENYSSFYDLDPGNQGGACRTDDVDLYLTWDPPDGGCNLGQTKATEWVAFTINVTQANTYVLSARVAHPGVGGTFHVEVDGVDVTGAMTVPDTVDWGEWRTIRRHGIALTAGQHQLKLVMDTVSPTTFAVGGFNYLALTRSAHFGDTPRAVPGKIEAEDFDVNADGGSGELAAYHDVTPANLGDAIYRFPEEVDIATTGDVGGGYQVGWTEDGEWLAYSVYIYTHGGYRLSMRVAHPGAGGTFHMEVDGVPVTGPIQIPDTGSWTNWQTITATTGYLPHGPHVIYLVLDTETSVTGAVANVNYFELSPEQAIGVSASTGNSSGAITLNDGWPFFVLGFSYFGAMEHDIGLIHQIFDLARNPWPVQPPPPSMPQVEPGWGPQFQYARIFPNWWAEAPSSDGEPNHPCGSPALKDFEDEHFKKIYNPNTLFTPSGGINMEPAGWPKLRQVIDAGKEKGMFIQLSMAMETVPTMTQTAYLTAMRELARLLSDYTYTEPGPNGRVLKGALWVILEVQNEYDNENTRICKDPFSLDYIEQLLDAVKNPTSDPPCPNPQPNPPILNCDSPRFTTLTFGGGGAKAEQVRAALNNRPGVPPPPPLLDWIAYEEVRNDPTTPDDEWNIPGHTYRAVREARNLTNNDIVIGLGETLSFDQAIMSPEFDPDEQWDAEDWWRAASEAKRAGAGFWTWHTRALFLYTDPDFPNQKTQLYPTERTVLQYLRSEVNRRVPDRCWGTAFPVPEFPPPCQ